MKWLFLLLSKIPFFLLYRLSDGLYLFTYYIIRYRRKVVMQNLANSFPEKTAQEREVIAKGFYKNLCDLTLETLKISSLTKEEIKKRVTITNVELMDSLAQKNISCITLTAHQCNWEWLLLGGSARLEHSIDAVYKPMHIKSLDQIFIKWRSRFGAEPLAMKDVYRSIIKNKGQIRCLAMVADQTPSYSEIQYITNFLNQPTAFFVGADKIAKSTGYPVLYFAMKRVKRGYYEATLHMLKEAPYEEKGFDITESYARLLEANIRQNPSDWLWSHRRWKHQSMKINRKK